MAKYAATIIQSQYTDAAVFYRPAVKGWEVVLQVQPHPGMAGPECRPMQAVAAISRKRDVGKAMAEAIQTCIDSINKSMAQFGGTEEWDLSVGQGFVEYDEIMH